ncbi:OLC1v1017310C1 [Oldenlandia corymbosa var. corymbosa]|uniref:OLC1v1017310C1 n=1 Tax=Oldenlandia corymbosa var. corymbosa TaxID=529605 RepID=A0AAV1E9C2_OLDCO|nr:OLC1v1017310C1 [Oldenlandia corymbosa var. corymbosa]
MSSRKRLIREFTGILKDKASIMKASLTTRSTDSAIKVAILRATTHTSAAPPPEHRLEYVLTLGSTVAPLASACVDSIMERLHKTRNPHVALKCLLVLHHILANGSFLFKQQLSYHPSNGGQNSLKLTRFRENRHVSSGGDVEDRELSQWVRWYASVLERNLILSRNLGCYIDFVSSSNVTNSKNRFSNLSRSIKEIDCLVSMVEEICGAPESLHHQKVDLVYELMLLVSEDYRGTQYHIIARLGELGSNRVIEELSSDDSAELLSCLKRLEGCKERLTEMFANRKRNDAFWRLVSQVRKVIEEVNEKREREKMVAWKSGDANSKNVVELTRNGGRVKGASHGHHHHHQAIKLLPYDQSGQWLTVVRV